MFLIFDRSLKLFALTSSSGRSMDYLTDFIAQRSWWHSWAAITFFSWVIPERIFSTCENSVFRFFYF